MHFKRTEIQNFKSIEKMSLNFSSGVNLLIGDDGIGGIGTFGSDLLQPDE